MLTIDILKDQIYRALMKPENRLEDGKPNWKVLRLRRHGRDCYGPSLLRNFQKRT
jgi:hypothetical protein